jgi:hypothetical protein
MWVISGIQRDTGRIRQHDDLSYWLSDEEIIYGLGTDARSGRGPWSVTSGIAGIVASRQRTTGLQANFGREVGTLEFRVERMDEWEPIITATWADDEAQSPGNPLAAARADGRGIMLHLEGFDPVRMSMVEHFELTHRIPETDILTAIGNPPIPYYGGLAPTRELVDLINSRIGLILHRDEIDYQVNPASRYGLVDSPGRTCGDDAKQVWDYL